jgi:hypothetical protein
MGDIATFLFLDQKVSTVDYSTGVTLIHPSFVSSNLFSREISDEKGNPFLCDSIGLKFSILIST